MKKKTPKKEQRGGRLSLWHAAFQPDGRYKKVYEKTPVTPYQRLLESPEVSDADKAELKRRKDSQYPAALNTALNKAVEKLLKLNREKASMKQASCQEAEQAEAV